MMVRDEHLPLGAGQASQALLAPAGGVQDRFPAGLAIGVGAGVDGVGEDVVDGGVACLDPADLVSLMHPQREFEPFRASHSHTRRAEPVSEKRAKTVRMAVTTASSG